MGEPVATAQESYGDFTVGAGDGDPWPQGAAIFDGPETPLESDSATAAGTALELSAPNGGEEVRVGQVLEIRWIGNVDRLTGVDLYLSMDGAIWLPMLDHSIFPEDDAWGLLEWKVPAQLDGVAIGGQVWIRVVDYNDGTLYDDSDNALRIAGSASLFWPPELGRVGIPGNRRLWDWRVEFAKRSGRLLRLDGRARDGFTHRVRVSENSR